MAESGLLLRERTGNQVFYQADPSCSIYEDLAAIFRKTMGLKSPLQHALSDCVDRIDAAFVFGSMASGRQTAGSDLDICIPGNLSLLEAVKALSPVQESLRREINPIVMKTGRFSKLATTEDRFVTRILSEPKLFLKANENELAKLVEDRAIRSA